MSQWIQNWDDGIVGDKNTDQPDPIKAVVLRSSIYSVGGSSLATSRIVLTETMESFSLSWSWVLVS